VVGDIEIEEIQERENKTFSCSFFATRIFMQEQFYRKTRLRCKWPDSSVGRMSSIAWVIRFCAVSYWSLK